MRIGIGKKIGGVYVGTSVSGKKAMNGLSMLILWPFYLIYYVCIWPFVAIYKAITKSNNKNKAIQAEMNRARTAEAQNYLRIIQESSKICSETKVPDTFFSRLDLCFETVEKLKPYADILNAESQSLFADADNFQSARVSEINSFIDRYAKETRIKVYELATDKAKANKVNAFKNILSEYNDKMTQENIDYYLNIAREMEEII